MKMNYDAIMGGALPLDGFVMGKMTVKMEVMKIHFSVRRYLICNLNCLLEVVLYICILQSWENFCWLYPKTTSVKPCFSIVGSAGTVHFFSQKVQAYGLGQRFSTDRSRNILL